MPREYQFDKIGENIYEHIMAVPDDKDIRKIAKEMSRDGKRVEILPNIEIPTGADGNPLNTPNNEAIIAAKQKIFPGMVNVRKNPDYRIEEEYFDLTRQTKPNTLEKVIKGKIKDKKKQGTTAII